MLSVPVQPGARSVILRASLVLLLMFEGCAQVPEQVPAPGGCVDGHIALESLARARGVYLSQPRAVDGYPALGSSRMLAGFDPATLNASERSDLLARLRVAGAQRRRLLLGMLEATADASSLPAWLIDYKPKSCESGGTATQPDRTLDWARLTPALDIEDDYSTAQRVLGLYPLSSLFVRPGIRSLQRDINSVHALSPEAVPIQGRLQRYSPARELDPEYAQILSGTFADLLVSDSLGPRPDLTPPKVLTALITRHAPVLEVDETGNFDVPGQPYFDATGTPRVDPAAALAYQYLSLMPFAGALRLQLNYVFWFDQRPDGGFFNSLSGALDGLVWRVTLGGAGEVLAYDSIHPCGCYHQFFPGEALIARSGIEDWPEPPLLPQAAPLLDKEQGQGQRGAQRIVLRVSGGAHYLQGVYADRPASGVASKAGPVRGYQLEPYAALYGVPGANGRQSLFGPRGIIPGTQRGERFYLWPMGVRSPGAMRERGRQATAFIGRRHFDDVDVLDQLFTLRKRGENP